MAQDNEETAQFALDAFNTLAAKIAQEGQAGTEVGIKFLKLQTAKMKTLRALGYTVSLEEETQGQLKQLE